MKQSAVLSLILFTMISFPGCIVQKSVYPAPSLEVPSPAPSPLREIRLTTDSRLTVTGWEFRNENLPGNMPVVLYLHGNAENLATLRQSGQFALLQMLNVHFVALDYPGYGRSEGKPSEKSVGEACDVFLKWVQSQYPDNPRIVCGWSLGAAAAITCAAANPDAVDGLIAVSGWTSLHDVASQFYPSWLVKIVVRDVYPSISTIQKISCPVLIIHGKNDRLIPFNQGKRLAEASPGCRFVPVPGRAHNDLLSDPAVWESIGEFMRQNLREQE
ncbi:MAG: alpha/beta fold hydrolase [Chitinivibrionales bacterium]|nr:alpha/beta fold hydrolase [Chitinivibrionales bacterium]